MRDKIDRIRGWLDDLHLEPRAEWSEYKQGIAFAFAQVLALFDEEPSREGKVKVVVRGYVDLQGEAYCAGYEAQVNGEAEWGSVEQDITDHGLLDMDGAARFEATLYVTPPAVEQVEDVEVRGGE